MNKNTKASIKNLEMQIDQLSQQMAISTSSSGGFISNTVDNLKNETWKAIELRNIVVLSNAMVSEENKESSEVVMKSEKKVVVEEEKKVPERDNIH